MEPTRISPSEVLKQTKAGKALLVSGGSGKLDRKVCFLSEALPG
jgi:hypothetical protein